MYGKVKWMATSERANLFYFLLAKKLQPPKSGSTSEEEEEEFSGVESESKVPVDTV